MIRLRRPEEPNLLRHPAVDTMRAEVRGFYTVRPSSTRRQERANFSLFPPQIFVGLLAELKEMSHGKCAYCESPLSSPSAATLERFRPKSGSVGLNRKDFSLEHYWWLAYEWSNFLCACALCNKSKGPKFPVKGARAPIEATAETLASEDRLLVDPCADDPTQHIDFDDSGRAVPRSPRGEVTIEILSLNRRDLVTQRLKICRARWAELRPVKLSMDMIEAELALLERLKIPGASLAPVPPTLQKIRRRLNPTQPFAALERAVYRQWLAHRKRSIEGGQVTAAARKYGQGAADKRLAEQARRSSTQTVTRIAVKNFRGIRDLDLPVHSSDHVSAPWLILLGENGTGKSSILQAVALTLSQKGTAHELGVTPKSVLRQGQAKGWVKVWIGQNESPRMLKFGRAMRQFQRTGPAFTPVLLGYGATRLLPRSYSKSSNAVRSASSRLDNMFDPFRPLLDADRWLGRLDNRSFDFAARSLKDVLGIPTSSLLGRVKRAGRPGVTLKLFRAKLSLNQLSDGYQSVLGLTCDLMSGLRLTGPDALEAAEGLVVLDELGAHLHPRWRMRIVGNLRKAFPRVQFLVSTHDPLCLRGLEDGEAVVFRRTSLGRIYQVPELPPLKGLRVDQLLTSEYFGLDTTMDPEIEELFRRLYYLLAVRTPTPKQQSEIATLRERLAPHEAHGTTRRERRLLEILDRELARVDQEPDPAKREAIRQESDNQIARDLNMLLAAPRSG